MPADPEPERYEGFVKRVLLLQATGTWCGWCPAVMASIKEYNNSFSDGMAVLPLLITAMLCLMILLIKLFSG